MRFSKLDVSNVFELNLFAGALGGSTASTGCAR